MTMENHFSNQTFENFIVSSCNRKAYDACRELVANPRSQFLTLYGPTSCGKTHLLSAVRNAYLEKYPKSKVLMSSYDEIIPEYIKALLKNKQDEFRKAICEFDLLIIDNMQFISGKTAIQEEIADWFSVMLTAGKSIIIAFDRSVQYFEKLISNIRNIYSESNMVIKLEEPDNNLRAKYLEQILQEYCVELPPTIKNYMVCSELISFISFKGYLLKFRLLQKQKGAEMTIDEMMKCLPDYKQEI